MAEGLVRVHGEGRFEAFSAGTEATAVRPEAIAVMAEIGFDISGKHSNSVERSRRAVRVCHHRMRSRAADVSGTERAPAIRTSIWSGTPTTSTGTINRSGTSSRPPASSRA